MDLDVVELVGLEGLAGWLGNLGKEWETDDGRESILYAARIIESTPSLLGLSAHLLAIARAPRQRRIIGRRKRGD